VWEAYTIQNYIDAFAQLGFSVCQDPGEEPGIYKVAIFVDVVGVPTGGVPLMVEKQAGAGS
jgi:hypothetical protein